MSYTKISKEEWLKLSQKEQEYLTLEFNKSVEYRKRIVVLVTRFIALLCIGALIYIGSAQYLAINGYNKVMSDYGSLGNCYLCGLETLRKCECQYDETKNSLNQVHWLNESELDSLKNYTAFYNIEPCPIRTSGGNGDYLNTKFDLNTLKA